MWTWSNVSSAARKPIKDRRLARAFLQWLIVAAIFIFIGQRLAADWDQLTEADLKIAPGSLALSVLLLGLYMLLRGFIWHHLTRLLDVAIPAGKAVAGWFYSQLGKYLPGKVFLFLGRLHYYKREGVSAGRFSLAFGLELVATFAASILTVLMAALTLDSPAVERYRPYLLLALVLLLISLHPRILTLFIRIGYRILRREPFEVTVSYGAMLRFVGLYILNWMIFGLALYAFIRSFHPIPASTSIYLAGAFSFSSLMGMIAVFVPSGLGVREGILGLFLIRLMPEALALLTALAARVWFTVVELLGIGAVAAFARLARPEYHPPTLPDPAED